MAEVKWIKITTDMFDNRKIKYIRKLPEGDSIVLIWVMLLTMAGRCNAGGRIFLTEDIPYNAKLLANELDFEESTVILALDALESLCMIDRSKEHITIPGWEEHQNIEGMEKIRESKRLAQARWRAKQKALPESSTVDSTVDSTEIESGNAEEEREEESEEEREYHSFTQSGERKKVSEGFSTGFSTREETKRTFLQGSLGKGVVFLSTEQIDDLLDKLSIEEFDRYVSIVADAELRGHHYRKKTHYQAILDMAMKDRGLK